PTTTLSLLHLGKIQLHRCRAAENRHRNPQLVLVVVHLFYTAVEIGKWPLSHANRLPHLEEDLRLWLFDTLLYLLQDGVYLALADGRGPHRGATNKARHLRSVLHQMPAVVGHFHLDEHVARKKLAFANVLLAAFHLDDLFHGYENLPETVLHSRALDSLFERACDALLETRIGVNNVPTLRHQAPPPITRSTTHASKASTIQRNSAMTITKATTTPVVWVVSFRLGHTTFFVSAMASCA